MPSIVNGLFAGRAGLSAHGIAIAVIGDNIGNASTLGYKQARSEFADLVAGGQGSRVTVGSGSRVAASTTIFSQGTLEFTGKPLDLAIDGNGFFAVLDGSTRYYTRAGNFKVDPDGNVVTQDDKLVLGFPEGGSGALEALNVNTISQAGIQSNNLSISGNLDAAFSDVIELSDLDSSSSGLALRTTTALDARAGDGDSSVVGSQAAYDTTYAELNDAAGFSTSVEVFDSLGQKHTITFFYFKDDDNARTWQVRGYVNSEDVDAASSGSWTAETGRPRLLTGAGGTPSSVTLTFNADGSLASAGTISYVLPWGTGSNSAQTLDVSLADYTQYATNSNVISITQDGQGVGNVTSFQVDKDGSIFAILDNGQQSTVGQIGLVNFANPEALTRIGNNLYQQSTTSGEPVVGKPLSGTFGSVESGSVELSTVDIADQFVKLITLQRGFQANSRIITTINQLLNEIIQLA